MLDAGYRITDASSPRRRDSHTSPTDRDSADNVRPRRRGGGTRHERRHSPDIAVRSGRIGRFHPRSEPLARAPRPGTGSSTSYIPRPLRTPPHNTDTAPVGRVRSSAVSPARGLPCVMLTPVGGTRTLVRARRPESPHPCHDRLLLDITRGPIAAIPTYAGQSPLPESLVPVRCRARRCYRRSTTIVIVPDEPDERDGAGFRITPSNHLQTPSKSRPIRRGRRYFLCSAGYGVYS